MDPVACCCWNWSSSHLIQDWKLMSNVDSDWLAEYRKLILLGRFYVKTWLKSAEVGESDDPRYRWNISRDASEIL